MNATFREPAAERALVVNGQQGQRERARRPRRAASRRAIGACALLAIVLCGALVVMLAADRPSLLSATTHAGFFPHWMAGPLGGLLPGLTRNSRTLKYLFTGALVVMYASYWWRSPYVPRLRARWAIGAVLAVHAIFFLAPPLALTDVFNYVNYGRMEIVHHLNPYTTIPILEPHNDPSYYLSNWHQLLSPYGPLFTLMTFALVPLGVAASFWAIKVILGAGEPRDDLPRVEVRAAARPRPDRGDRARRAEPDRAGLGPRRRPQRLPDGLLHRARLLPAAPARAPCGGGRAGAPRRPQLRWRTVAVPWPRRRAPGWPAGRGRSTPGLREQLRGWLWPLAPLEIGAGMAFVTAAAIKASGAILIPVVLAALLQGPAPRRRRSCSAWRWPTAVVGAASLIAFGLHIPDLSTQSRLVTNVSVPNLLGLALGSGGETEDAPPGAERGAGAVGAVLLRARLAPARRDHGQRLGDASRCW